MPRYVLIMEKKIREFICVSLELPVVGKCLISGYSDSSMAHP